MALSGIWIVICVYVMEASAKGPRCPPAARADLCAESGSSVDEYFYQVKGSPLKIAYSEAKYYHLTCRPDLGLDDAALPAFDAPAPVAQVKLTACAPPAAGFARALLALNVSAGAVLELDAAPAAPALGAAHLRGLRLTAFALAAAAPQRFDPAALDALAGLRDLRLSGAELTPAATLRLPATLRSLSLARAAPELPAAALARLPELARLIVSDERLRALDASAAPALLELRAAAPLGGLALGAAVRELRLRGARGAELRGNCSALRRVELHGAAALPAAWLARCGGVRELRVSGAAGALGGAELRGARALERLSAQYCALRELPARWLEDATALLELDLSHNALEQFPSLVANERLHTVAATHNALRRDALAPLAALPALRSLALDSNPLHDLCGHSDAFLANGLSPLRTARGLRALSLQRTNATRVCSDWRVDLPRLGRLDLRHNSIAELGPADLDWSRDEPAEVDLRGNGARFAFTEQDYLAELGSTAPPPPPAAPRTTLRLDDLGRCDCREYWFARAWRRRAERARAVPRPLSCAGRALLDVPPEELACDVRVGCPAGCRCRASGVASELRCAGLTRVPRPAPPLHAARALLLADNAIAHVRLEDVTPELEVLDLSGNNVTRIDAATTAALFGAPRMRLLLAGNPLDCSCAALPLLRAVAAAPARVADLPRARCAAGQRLADAAARAAAACARLPLGPALGAALALAAASAAGAACLARPAVRHRLKRFLFERGLCLRWALRPLGADERRPYDAFVSFSHLDARYAAELARRLEPARRLCLHERDWVPGEWIPAQIARSVRLSRRTLVLLSDNFLASTWARAELREAYAAALRDERPRLLLLLLPAFPPAAAAGADPALRAYLASVTYLRWDDPGLWDKLRLALPPRAAAAPAAPANPAPAPRPPPPPP